MPGVAPGGWGRHPAGRARGRRPAAAGQGVAGELSARTLASTRLAETWIHTGDIAAGLGVDLVPTDRLWHMARLAWRTLPYAFAQAGRGSAGRPGSSCGPPAATPRARSVEHLDGDHGPAAAGPALGAPSAMPPRPSTPPILVALTEHLRRGHRRSFGGGRRRPGEGLGERAGVPAVAGTRGREPTESLSVGSADTGRASTGSIRSSRPSVGPKTDPPVLRPAD